MLERLGRILTRFSSVLLGRKTGSAYHSANCRVRGFGLYCRRTPIPTMENVMRKVRASPSACSATGAIGFVSPATRVNAAEITSGLKPGDAPAAFQVQDATGPAAGTKLCYRCRYGSNPVVAVFTHKIDDKVTSLVKKVDAE